MPHLPQQQLFKQTGNGVGRSLGTKKWSCLLVAPKTFRDNFAFLPCLACLLVLSCLSYLQECFKCGTSKTGEKGQQVTDKSCVFFFLPVMQQRCKLLIRVHLLLDSTTRRGAGTVRRGGVRTRWQRRQRRQRRPGAVWYE